nr:type transport system ATP-binding protein [Candidatus Cloacimonadota bacterium]
MTVYDKTIDNHHGYEIVNLSKNYGKFRALDDVTFSLPQGRIIGLLGKNGAGKSTLMRCMLGLLRHRGSVILDGMQLKHRDHRVFEQVAFISDASGLDDRLTVKQSIDYVRNIHPKFDESRCQKLLLLSNLPANKKVGKLSKGMKTKLNLILTLSLDVRYLILDEPTLGLDISFRKEFLSTILGEYFDEERTIFISTHQVEEIEDILHEIIFLDQGKIVINETVDSLKSKYHVVRIPSDQEDLLKNHNPKILNRSLGLVYAVLPSDINIDGANYSRASLSDIFMEVVGGYNETV